MLVKLKMGNLPNFWANPRFIVAVECKGIDVMVLFEGGGGRKATYDTEDEAEEAAHEIVTEINNANAQEEDV